MSRISMEVVNPHAAGIDVGSRFHMVAVGPNKDEDVEKFGIYTSDHESMIIWLKERGVTTIAMESTGSYWQTLFSALQIAGFEVLLVNGAQTRNANGKKTDVSDCMEIQKRHSLGLLYGSFIPGEFTEQLRTYYKHREHIVQQLAKYTNKLQKALRLMNIRLDVAISDVNGKSGKLITKAIIAGQRDPLVLASLADKRVKKSQEEIALSLQGNWREDLLFEVKECVELYDFFESKLAQIDQRLEEVLSQVNITVGVPISLKSEIKKNRTKNSPRFDVQSLAYAHYGVDLSAIPSLSHGTLLCLLTNLTKDEFKKFSSHKHFISWMRLAPNNKITGGKVVSSRTPKSKNPVALALRQVANSIGNMKEHIMHGYFRRIAYKKGRGAAITATARKLGVIIYNMITRQEPYQLPDLTQSILSHKKYQLKNIKKQLSKLNLSQDELLELIVNPCKPIAF